MLSFANTWAPVHAYYAAYGSLQAWFTANRMAGVADDHIATLNTIANHIEQRDLFPALSTVTRATVALLELFVMRKIGKAEFDRIAVEFVHQDLHNLSQRMLRARLGAYGIAV